MLIPVDYWHGGDNLKYEYPWLTPESIYFLEGLLKSNPNFEVLEFGCGGSTLFFSRRCKKVVSYETQPKWITEVAENIIEKGITNVTLRQLTSIEEIKSTVTSGFLFDIILVDNNPIDYSRIHLMKSLNSVVKNQGYLILDNYACWLDEEINSMYKDWEITDYDDLKWAGKGTRIYRKNIK